MLSIDSKVQQPQEDKRKLLFIDDDSSVIASLHLLFDSSYETFSASTVEEGLRIFEQIHPRIVILDLKLPDKSGIEALRAIRKIDSSAAVVILTGYSTRLAAEESLRLGAVDYLNKPLNSVDLQNRIRKLALTIAERENDQQLEHSVNESLHHFCDFRDFQNASAAFLHDVSGPLSCLMAGSDILSQKIFEKDKITADEIGHVITMMSNSVGYLRSLVNQWRSFSELHTLMHDKVEAQKAIDLALTPGHEPDIFIGHCAANSNPAWTAPHSGQSFRYCPSAHQFIKQCLSGRFPRQWPRSSAGIEQWKRVSI